MVDLGSGLEQVSVHSSIPQAVFQTGHAHNNRVMDFSQLKLEAKQIDGKKLDTVLTMTVVNYLRGVHQLRENLSMEVLRLMGENGLDRKKIQSYLL